MLIKKEIIQRVAISFLFIFISLKFITPLLFYFFKQKLSFSKKQNNDIDILIKRQRELFHSQQALPKMNIPKTPKNEIMTKEIKEDISKNFSYLFADSKINSFLFINESKNYLDYLSKEQINSKESIIHFISTFIIFISITEEIKERKFYLLEKIAHKLKIPSYQLALAFQIKLLLIMSKTVTKITEETLFNDSLILHQFTNIEINESIEKIAVDEAFFWAKGPFVFLEKLATALTYSSILTPLPILKNKKDIETAKRILNIKVDDDIEIIKKNYKKMAILKHPDKLSSLNLPKFLEKKSLSNFNSIQAAYEILIEQKK